MTDRIKWSIDQAHSEMAFKVKDLMYSHVKGVFKTFGASITTSKDFTNPEIDLWIDSSSISTGDSKCERHLKETDFLDVQNHKLITFTSNTIRKSAIDNSHELWGELTVKGITKNIKLNVQSKGILVDTWGNEKAGFTVTGKIKRSYWGLVWNSTIETRGILVSDEVTISCDVELINTNKKELLLELESTAD